MMVQGIQSPRQSENVHNIKSHWQPCRAPSLRELGESVEESSVPSPGPESTELDTLPVPSGLLQDNRDSEVVIEEEHNGEPDYTGKMYLDLYTRDGCRLYYPSSTRVRVNELVLYADRNPSVPFEHTAAGRHGTVWPSPPDGAIDNYGLKYTAFYTHDGVRLRVRPFEPRPQYFFKEGTNEPVSVVMYVPRHEARREPSPGPDGPRTKTSAIYTYDGVREYRDDDVRRWTQVLLQMEVPSCGRKVNIPGRGKTSRHDSIVPGSNEASPGKLPRQSHDMSSIYNEWLKLPLCENDRVRFQILLFHILLNRFTVCLCDTVKPLEAMMTRPYGGSTVFKA